MLHKCISHLASEEGVFILISRTNLSTTSFGIPTLPNLMVNKEYSVIFKIGGCPYST